MRRHAQMFWIAVLMLLSLGFLSTGSATRPLRAAEFAAPGNPAELSRADEPLANEEPVWLIADKQVSARETAVGSILAYTLTFTVADMVTFPITVTDILSPSLEIYAARSSHGTLTTNATGITCVAEVDPTAPLVIEFWAIVRAPGITTNVAHADAGSYGQYSTPVVMTSVGAHNVYLPGVITVRPAPGISGRVTLNGAPVSNTVVELRFFDGYSWSTRANVALHPFNGSFLFSDVPSLGPGQLYYVLYRRELSYNPGLTLWSTRTLTSYTKGDSVFIGAFDVADAPLLEPADEAAVYFPVNFRWGPRGVAPTDSYEFNLFDPYDLDPYLYAILGYTGEFTLYSLPPVLNIGDLYAWYIGINALDGGYGIGEMRLIYFENTGLHAATVDAEAQLLEHIEAQKVQRRQ